MELSELTNFNGELLTFDDRSGIISAIDLIKKVDYDSDLIPSPYTP